MPYLSDRDFSSVGKYVLIILWTLKVRNLIFGSEINLYILPALRKDRNIVK